MTFTNSDGPEDAADVDWVDWMVDALAATTTWFELYVVLCAIPDAHLATVADQSKSFFGPIANGQFASMAADNGGLRIAGYLHNKELDSKPLRRLCTEVADRVHHAEAALVIERLVAELAERPHLIPGDAIVTVVNMLMVCCEHTRQLTVLTAAIGTLTAHTPTYDHYLAVLYRYRFVLSDKETDIDVSISLSKDTINSIRERHADLPAMLSNHATSLLVRFDRYGRPADINDAVTAGGDAVTAVAASSPGHHSDLPAMLSNYANCLLRRFERFARPADIDDAVIATDDAIVAAKANPDGHSDLPALLSSHANCLRVRFERFRVRGDIDAAVEFAAEAVADTPARHPNLPGRRSRHANSLLRRFEEYDELEDINAAVTAAAAAVTAAAGHPDLTTMLCTHAGCLSARFKRYKQPADFVEAVQLGWLVLQDRRLDLPDRTGWLANQAQTLFAGFDDVGTDDVDPLVILDLLSKWCDHVERFGGDFDAVFAPTRGWCEHLARWATIGLCDWQTVETIATTGLMYANKMTDQLTADALVVMRYQLDGVGSICAYAQLMRDNCDGAIVTLEATGATIARLQASSIDWQIAHERAPLLAAQAFALTDQIKHHKDATDPEVQNLQAHHHQTIIALREELQLPVSQPATLAQFTASGNAYLWIITTEQGGAIIRHNSATSSHTLLPALTTTTISNWHLLLHPPPPVKEILIKGESHDDRPQRVAASTTRVTNVGIRGAGGTPGEDAITSVLDELDEALAPADGWLDDDAWLIPAGTLRLLPWQARHPHRRLHLTATHTLNSHTPSSTNRTVVFADPTNDLPGAKREAIFLGQHGAETYVGSNATLHNLVNLVGPIDTLHFASHGTNEPALWFHGDQPLDLNNIHTISHVWPTTSHLILNCCISAQHLPGLHDETLSIATIALTHGTTSATVALWPLDDDEAATWAIHHHHPQHPDTTHHPTHTAYLTWGRPPTRHPTASG